VKSVIVATVVGILLAAPLGAQVGHEPQKSPFRDLERTMEFTVFSGTYRARQDPARVAPQSGPMIGVQYQWRASGPLSLTGGLSRVESQRRVLDPERVSTCGGSTTPNPDCKLVGEFRWPLYFLDGGLALDLTGPRTFYGFVPDLKAGVGILSDFHSRADVGEFSIGTRFAIKWGGGIRWVPSELFQIRAEVTNYLHSVGYPESYYTPATDNSQIRPLGSDRSAWLNNTAFTIGLSYLFSR
jgi:hypothetical protein